MDIDQKGTFFITCSRGLEPLLGREVERLGYGVDDSSARGVATTAPLRAAMRLNLHLGTASGVLFLLKEFRCKSADELYNQTRSLPWEEMISPDEYVSVVSSVDTESISHTNYPNLKVKDAIVDAVAAKTGARPNSGPERDNVVVSLYWKGDRCSLYLNTSGGKLSDRGYRMIPGKAPLRENLAAGIILSTGYDGRQPLVVPMCGTGTLAIEAALIGQGIAPGLLRKNFGFLHIKGFTTDEWRKVRQQAAGPGAGEGPPGADRAGRGPLPRIIASDIDPEMIAAGRKNAAAAGVGELIDFAVCDFADTPIPAEKGIIVVNPEYGMRLGEVQALESTYSRLGDFFKQKCAGWTAYIFTGNPALSKKVGLRASRRIPFFNARIECRLLRYDMYEGSRK
ncbi:MAG: class I SAM-dependent RNA methyltransferase [Planctomycetota bacterium]|nr:class I SAM-dependent RNA methyltransferase [Planctomycetota bacterium]